MGIIGYRLVEGRGRKGDDDDEEDSNGVEKEKVSSSRRVNCTEGVEIGKGKLFRVVVVNLVLFPP